MDSRDKVYLKDYQVPEFLIDTIDLTLDLDPRQTHVSSHLKIQRNEQSKSQSKDIVLDGDNLKLISVALNDKLLETSQYDVTNKTLTIKNVPDNFTVDIQTEINPKENTKLSGLYTSNDNFTTQCEAQGFRRITYFLDRPDVMAKYTTTVIADKKTIPVLLSNGNLKEKGEMENGKHWITWEDPFRKPSYLFALVAGNFEFIEDKFITQSGKEVALFIFAEPGYRDRLDHAMQALKKSMKWDEENYGRECDLESYKIVAISNFNAGAMENKGLNIFNSKYIFASPETATDRDFGLVDRVIAHEYFHNWTGNRITCRDWFQLSLKEGLTTFREGSYSENTSSVLARIEQANVIRTKQFAEDSGPLAHPVQPKSYLQIENFYTPTVYEKGAEIYRMLQTTLGKELFRKGMDNYFKKYDGQAVTIEDYVQAIAEGTGKDLSQFLLWFHQAGTPVLDVTDDYNETEQTYTLKIKQTCPPTPDQKEKKPFPIPIKMGLLDKHGNALLLDESPEATTDKVLLLTEAEQTFVFKKVRSRPIPSLLRGFSAPIKLNYDYKDDDLKIIANSDEDLFNRWDAINRYLVKTLLTLIDTYKQHQKITVSSDLIETFSLLLKQNNIDLKVLSKMLTIPSEAEIAEHLPTIDVEAIYTVRNQVVSTLAKNLQPLLLETYKKCHSDEKNYNQEEAGKRALKNTCLIYLSELSDPSLAKQQFESAVNMTDTMAALSALNNIDCQERSSSLNNFIEKRKDDLLAKMKYFNIIAASQLPHALEAIKQIKNSSEFDIKIPNHVYALIRAFINNFKCFHTKEGYEFLTNLILELDPINPKIAAGCAEYFAQWERYDEAYKVLMHQQLMHIYNQKNLSTNVMEIVSKSLGVDEKQLSKEEKTDLRAVVEDKTLWQTSEPSNQSDKSDQIALISKHWGTLYYKSNPQWYPDKEVNKVEQESHQDNHRRKRLGKCNII